MPWVGWGPLSEDNWPLGQVLLGVEHPACILKRAGATWSILYSCIINVMHLWFKSTCLSLVVYVYELCN